MTEQFQSIALERIQRSNYNPRHHFDDSKLAELAASIKEKGVLEPILVRQLHITTTGAVVGDIESTLKTFPGLANTLKFEIVAGERRFRAAKLAELTEIPAIIRNLTDQEAAEIAIVENAQRADLTPVEEARGFKTLIEQFNYSIEDAAAKMGLSPKTVAQRVRLLRLPAKALDAIESGDLALGAADHLAKMENDQLREEAVKMAINGDQWGNGNKCDESLSARETLHLIRHRFMTDLSKAPFSTADKTLNPAAGSCAACPQRSGNQQGLFDEIKEKNVCLNIACFAQKKAVHQERLLLEAKTQGLKILDEKEAKQVFPYRGADLAYNAAYVDADSKFLSDTAAKKRSFKQLIGKTVEPVVAVDPEGQVRHLYPKAVAQKALKTAGFVAASAQVSGKDQKSQAEKDREMQSKADAAGMMDALRLARASAACMVPKFSTPGQIAIWKTIAQGYIGNLWDDTIKTFNKAFDITPSKEQTTVTAAKAYLSNASDAESYVACLIISLIRLDGYDSDGTKKKALAAGFDALGIDLAELRAEQLRQLKEKDAMKAATASTKPKARKATA